MFEKDCTTAYRYVLRAKIHRATVTAANVDYEGSVTIPPELMQAAGLCPYEAVHVWNVTNGARFETYAIQGLPNSLDICINGAAAHLAKPGHLVIIASFIWLAEEKVASHKPALVFVDDANRRKPSRAEIPGPLTRANYPSLKVQESASAA